MIYSLQEDLHVSHMLWERESNVDTNRRYADSVFLFISCLLNHRILPKPYQKVFYKYDYFSRDRKDTKDLIYYTKTPIQWEKHNTLFFVYSMKNQILTLEAKYGKDTWELGWDTMEWIHRIAPII